MITKSIQLFFDSLPDWKERIQLSKGVQKASSDSNIYEPDAYIPAGSWRAPSPKELSSLVTVTVPQRWHETIGIYQLPSPIINTCRSLGLEEATSQPSIFEIIQQKKSLVNKLSRQFSRYLKSFTHKADEDQIRLHGFFVNPPGLETVAIHENSLRFHGLHLDYGGPGELANASIQTNRVCINIGKGPRYILYINKPVKEIIALINEYEGRQQSFTGDDFKLVKNLFFHYFSSCPVIKVKLMPYECYIAPTDNIIHDGSTEHSTTDDVNVVFLGRFNIKSS